MALIDVNMHRKEKLVTWCNGGPWQWVSMDCSACLYQRQVDSVTRCDLVQVSNVASQAAPDAGDGSGVTGEERYTRLPPVNSAGLAKLQVRLQTGKLCKSHCLTDHRRLQRSSSGPGCATSRSWQGCVALWGCAELCRAMWQGCGERLLLHVLDGAYLCRHCWSCSASRTPCG